jgi:hypothetical protein
MDTTFQVNELDQNQLTSLDANLESGWMDRCQSGFSMIQVNTTIPQTTENAPSSGSQPHLQHCIQTKPDVIEIENSPDSVAAYRNLEEPRQKQLQGWISNSLDVDEDAHSRRHGGYAS